MLRDILACIPTERAPAPLVDVAVSLGVMFEAHVEAVAPSYVTINTSYVVPAVAEELKAERRRAVERSEGALLRFERAARASKISYDCRSIIDFPTLATAKFATSARIRDLAIVLQSDAPSQSVDSSSVTEIVLQAGGPVLIVPNAFAGPFKPKRIGVCWDGSSCAARAIRDARAFLSLADAVVVITISEGDAGVDKASAEALAVHLRRVGVPMEPVELTAVKCDVQPMILSVALDEDIDMLVLGAYGRSRLREIVFGGVTLAMLKAMPVPILVSH